MSRHCSRCNKAMYPVLVTNDVERSEWYCRHCHMSEQMTREEYHKAVTLKRTYG